MEFNYILYDYILVYSIYHRISLLSLPAKKMDPKIGDLWRKARDLLLDLLLRQHIPYK